MKKEQMIKALGTYLRAFLAAVLTAYYASGQTPFSVSSNDLKTFISAGVAAILPVILVAVNPRDDRYGFTE
jgi:hypothetical protein